MKNFPKMICRIILGIFLVAIILGVNIYFNHREIKDGMVVDVNGEAVTVEDVKGERWDFIGGKYYVGQWIRMYMDTNGTENPYDDEIIDVKVLE